MTADSNPARPMRVVIADDEPLARKGLRRLLAAEPDVELLAEAAHGREVIAAIREHRPDLLFLDIEMPEVDGFAVLRELAEDPLPAVVFVTAHQEYAVQAFEACALDYLLKPIGAERFQATLERVRHQLARAATPALDWERLAALLLPAGEPAFLERLVVRENGRLLLVRVEEIDWLEAADSYVVVHTGAVSHILNEKISLLEQRLDPKRFLRIHRSRMVNVDRVREIQPLFSGDYLLRLHDGTEITTGRSFRDRLRPLLSHG